MGELLVLFLAGLIGLILRLIVIGEFDPNQLYLLLLFPAAALLFLIIDHFLNRMDRSIPKLVESVGKVMIYVSNANRASTVQKPIMKNGRQVGIYRRYYPRW